MTVINKLEWGGLVVDIKYPDYWWRDSNAPKCYRFLFNLVEEISKKRFQFNNMDRFPTPKDEKVFLHDYFKPIIIEQP